MTRERQSTYPDGSVGPSEVARLLGVTTKTVARWALDNTLVPSYETRGGHRRYDLDTVNAIRALLEEEKARDAASEA